MDLRRQFRRGFGELCEAAVQCLQKGDKLMLFGNGVNADDAQHIATEPTVRLRNDRQELAAPVLITDGLALTAVDNDLGIERTFSRQIEALAKPGDAAIRISTFGTSANCSRACRPPRRATASRRAPRGAAAARWRAWSRDGCACPRRCRQGSRKCTF